MQSQNSSTIALTLTKELKQLINISIAAGKFMMLHPYYTLIQQAMDDQLINDGELEDFEVYNWQYEVGETVFFDQQQACFFYALLELTCRIFISDIADDLKEMAIKSGEMDEAAFNRLRNTHLKHCQQTLSQIEETMKAEAHFNSLKNKLQKLVI
ncbi:MAG: hypothetical protein RIQ89_1977 [Bacteroidota bacterium]|jgi:hypothetical protein